MVNQLQPIFPLFFFNVLLGLVLLIYNIPLFILQPSSKGILINKGLFYISLLVNNFLFVFWLLWSRNFQLLFPANLFLLSCLLQWFSLIKKGYGQRSNRLVDLLLAFINSFLLIINAYMIFVFKQEIIVLNFSLTRVNLMIFQSFILSGCLYFFVLSLSSYLCFREIKFKKKYFFNSRLPTLKEHLLETDKLLIFLNFIFLAYLFTQLLVYFYAATAITFLSIYNTLDIIFYSLIAILLGGGFVVQKIKGFLPNQYFILAALVLFLFFLSKVY